MQVYDHDRFSADEMIGTVFYPLAQVDLSHLQLEWKDLQTSSDVEQVRSRLSTFRSSSHRGRFGLGIYSYPVTNLKKNYGTLLKKIPKFTVNSLQPFTAILCHGRI